MTGGDQPSRAFDFTGVDLGSTGLPPVIRQTGR
jgi:hypothetical protein